MSGRTIRDAFIRWVRKLRVRRCTVPFVILFLERSGSTYLCSLLDNHKQITCRQEDFHGVFSGRVDSPESRKNISNWSRRIQGFGGKLIEPASEKDAITHFHDLFSFPTVACGFKFKFPRQFQLFPEIVEEFRWLSPALHVIVLSRRNVLKQAVSRQNLDRIVSATGRANLSLKNSGIAENLGQFELNVEQAIQYARFTLIQQAEMVKTVEQMESELGVSTLPIHYEDLLSERDVTLHRVFDFMKLDTNVAVPESQLKKATSDRLESALSNYDQLVRAVHGTPFAEMLDPN